jgi:hypothetical protein
MFIHNIKPTKFNFNLNLFSLISKGLEIAELSAGGYGL